MGMFFWVKKVVPALIVAADGSGDFTTIQAAVDALPDTGGEIHVKAGTYTLTEKVTIDKSNVTIGGAGKSTIVDVDGSFEGFNIEGVDHIVINNIYFYGDGTTIFNKGIYMVSSNYSIITGCWFSNFKANAFWINNGAAESNYIIITNNHFLDDINVDLNVTKSDYITIVGNYFEGGPYNGIDMSNCKYALISTNLVINCTEDGIAFSATTYSTIQFNIVRNCTEIGINLESVSDSNIVINNIVLDNGTNIDDTSANNQISHNTTS